MPTRILVIGGGGREHALAWKLGAEPGVNEVVVAPGSDAIAREPRVRCAGSVDPLDPGAIVALARERAVELVVVGPEAPLAAGVADALTEAGFAVFGPSAAAARIETSKSYCHGIATAAGVAMARSASFADAHAAAAFCRDEAARGDGVVVKADGLAAGKGVTVAADAGEAVEAVGRLAADGVDRFVIEERLRGPEASVIAICDGRRAVVLPAARDHKRLLDGDEGPNTGGMGAYSPLPDLPAADAAGIVDSFHAPILAELARRGTPFRGFLYAGLMLTDEGPRLLECNARLGDPEAQVILPRLAAPLGPLLLAAARGALDASTVVPAMPGAAVGIVLAAAGYPARPRRGDRIDGLDDAADDALVFHAGTRLDGGAWTTDGGRVLTVVGRGGDLDAARERAEATVDGISWAGMQRRHDIARVSQSVSA
ncbi:MAG TPA: phosphoribosylamine--glycine ligase [Candidatus Limnocylindrales bacterium]|nr:phosphoribosylamine--glycine ligase [Candidatus Limnocylindrales bacterium]